MDDIPQSFKVQWINSTLKYIKDDSQLVMEYPEMPVHHMEYLHYLIWQRRNDVGLGFKSMYAPVWEAMKIYSLKYKFKVLVNKSEDGKIGNLVIEKVLKKEPENQDHVSDNQYSSESEAESSPPETKGAKKKPRKVRPRKNKSEKFYENAKKILDSISPTLLRQTLQKIYTFMSCEMEASLTFSNIAPVERRFLENFLGIYNRKSMFQAILSPACNELLDNISQLFLKYENKIKLEVHIENNNYTKMREVVLLKVPKYTRSNACEEEMYNVTLPPPKQIQSDKHNNAESKSQKPKEYQTDKLNLTITVPNERLSDRVAIDSRDVKLLSMSGETTDNKPKDNVETSGDRVQPSNELPKSEIGAIPSTSKIGAIPSTSKIGAVPSTSKIGAVPSTSKIGAIPSTSKIGAIPSTSKIGAIPSTSKIGAKPSTSKIGAIPSTSQNFDESAVPVKKVVNTNVKACPFQRKEKLLEAMSTPLESDKALRMMRLMGWEGGALGLRGEGIIEPIVPALDLVRFKGFGHGKSKPKPPKPAKPMKESDLRKNLIANRTEFLKSILDLLERDFPTLIIVYPARLVANEVTCYKNIAKHLNMGHKTSLTSGEARFLEKIRAIMAKDKDLTLHLVFSDDNSQITIKKSYDCPEGDIIVNKTTQSRQKVAEDIRKPKVLTKNQFREYIWDTIVGFINSEEEEMEVRLDVNINSTNQRLIKIICDRLNKRLPITCKDLTLDISEKPRDYILQVQYDDNQKRSFVLRKITKKNLVNIAVVKKLINDITIDANKSGEITNEKKEDVETSKTVHNNTSSYEESCKRSNEVDITPISNNNNISVSQKHTEENSDNVNKYTFNIKNVINNEIYSLKNSDKDYNSNDNEETTKKYTTRYTNLITSLYEEFGNINKHIIQNTVESFTLHNSVEDFKINSEAKEMITNNSNYENNDMILNDNKLDFLSNIETSRKWYECSDKFLNCDNLVKDTTVKDIDPNNNKNCATNIDNSEVYEMDVKQANIDIDCNESKDAIKTTNISDNNSGEVHSRSDNCCLKDFVVLTEPIKTCINSSKSETTNMTNTKNKEVGSITDLIVLTEPTEAYGNNSKFEITEAGLDNIDNLEDVGVEKFNGINNTISDNDINGYDLIIIESNDDQIEAVQKTVQSLIEEMLSFEDEFLPLLKYHGVVDVGIVYSCYNKETYLWLKRVLFEYRIVDYRQAINNHIMKIKVKNVTNNVNKILKLLEICNTGIKCQDWKIISEKQEDDLLILGVEIDRHSFEYVCDQKFSLFAGFDVAQFSVGR